MINFTAIFTSIEKAKREKQENKIRKYAEKYPNQFIKIAVDEIGAVELAEYLHHMGDLFELVDGLASEALADFEDDRDYHRQIETNYRR